MNSTKTAEEVEDAQLGLGILRSLIGIDADEVQNAATKAWTDGHMKLWQQRGGLEATGIPAEPKDDDMGHTVSIGNTYYQSAPPATAPPPAANPEPAPAAPAPSAVAAVKSKLPTWLAPALLGAGLTSGIAGTAYMLNKPTKPATAPAVVDTDTRAISSFRIFRPDQGHISEKP